MVRIWKWQGGIAFGRHDLNGCVHDASLAGGIAGFRTVLLYRLGALAYNLKAEKFNAKINVLSGYGAA